MTDALDPPFDPWPRTHPADRAWTRRPTMRVTGPFEGQRMGAIDVPIRIHDLTSKGCLIESHHEVAIGKRIALQIDLPGEGWISLEAESVHIREQFGYAVMFVDVGYANRCRIDRAIARLLDSPPAPDWTLDNPSRLYKRCFEF